MKKNDLLLLVSIATYSLLFYQQSIGINFLIFTIVLQVFSLIRKPLLFMNNAWIAASAGALLSGICCALYGSELAMLANIVSLSLMAGFSVATDSSLIFAGFYSVFSYITSWFELLKEKITSKARLQPSFYPLRSVLMITVLPVLVLILFLNLYRSSNPLFQQFLENLKFDFISIGWLFFTLGGAIVLLGFFYPKSINYLRNLDFRASDNLSSSSYLFSEENRIKISSENLSGIVLLSLLNLLLLIVNVLDVQFLFITKELPQGVTYSQFIHQGIYTLIVSVLLAIGIILYYFKGSLNFFKDNKALKALTYIWIIQNAFLIVTCIAKNSIYIQEYSLTYKRIGVYVYLLLTFIGLFTTFIKIIYTKNNWFLFRKNSWAFYTILILSCFVNWDLLIAKYNLTYKPNPDIRYLLSLSDTVLPELLDYQPAPTSEKLSYTEVQEQENMNYQILYRQKQFLQKYKEQGWQSWNYNDYQVNEQLNINAIKLND
ncbi:MAG TPA: DUF4173 domain-containing protein [Cytophagaceae bacterium]